MNSPDDEIPGAGGLENDPPLHLAIEQAAARLRTSAVRSEKCFGVIRLTADTALRICLTNYRGREIVSLRVWWFAPDQTWVPTKKGVTLRPTDAATVAKALSTAAELCSDKGVSPN